jgi:hypothetical protein
MTRLVTDVRVLIANRKGTINESRRRYVLALTRDRQFGVATRLPVGTAEGSIAGRCSSSFFQNMQTGSGAYPASYSVGTGALSVGDKVPVAWSCHSPSSSAEVTSTWKCAFTCLSAFMAWCMIKHRHNVTFSYPLAYIVPKLRMHVRWLLLAYRNCVAGMQLMTFCVSTRICLHIFPMFVGWDWI